MVALADEGYKRGTIRVPPVLAEAIEASSPHRLFRDPAARLFPDSGADALRTAIAKAHKAEGIPPSSPHDLRHRRISLLRLRSVPWARIGEFVGRARGLRITMPVTRTAAAPKARIAGSAAPQKAGLSMPTAKIPRRGEAVLEAVTTLTAPMVSLRRLTSAVRGEGTFAVVLSLAVADASLRGMET